MSLKKTKQKQNKKTPQEKSNNKGSKIVNNITWASFILGRMIKIIIDNVIRPNGLLVFLSLQK